MANEVKNFIQSGISLFRRAAQATHSESNGMAQVLWTATVVGALGLMAIYTKVAPHSELLSATVPAKSDRPIPTNSPSLEMVRTPAELAGQRTVSEKRADDAIGDLVSPNGRENLSGGDQSFIRK